MMFDQAITMGDGCGAVKARLSLSGIEIGRSVEAASSRDIKTNENGLR
jgi:hypothetical protein